MQRLLVLCDMLFLLQSFYCVKFQYRDNATLKYFVQIICILVAFTFSSWHWFSSCWKQEEQVCIMWKGDVDTFLPICAIQLSPGWCQSSTLCIKSGVKTEFERPCQIRSMALSVIYRKKGTKHIEIDFCQYCSAMFSYLLHGRTCTEMRLCR